MSKDIIRDQTYTFDGVNYRAGRPIPEEVAQRHGLIRKESIGTEEAPSEGDPSEGAPLPEDFPARDLLLEAGFETIEAVQGATDEELRAIDGIGPKRLDDIALATAGSHTEEA